MNTEPRRVTPESHRYKRQCLRLVVVLIVVIVAIALLKGLDLVIQRDLTNFGKMERDREKAEALAAIRDIRSGRSNSLDLYGTANSDAYIAQAVELPAFEELALDRTDVTDNGIAELRRAKNIRRVTLMGCGRLTNESLDYLSQVPALRELRLYDLPISDSGVEFLTQAKALAILELRYLPLTPAVFPHLKKLTQLELLDIRGPWVSENAVKELHEAMPRTKIVAHYGEPGTGKMQLIERHDPK